MAQLERADRYLFTKLSEYTRQGLRGSIAPGLPLDQFIERILESSKYTMLLMPLARSSSSSGASSSSALAEPPAKRAKVDKQTAQIENLRRQVENLKRKGPEPSGKAKRQKAAQQEGKGQKRPGPMPTEIKGHLSSVSKGPLCFGYNMGIGCKDAARGQKCRRGWHLCCHKDCDDREGHSFVSCPRRR